MANAYPISDWSRTAPKQLKTNHLGRMVVLVFAMFGTSGVLTPVDGRVAAPSGGASATHTSAARVFTNCAALNKVYPHGVGRKGAKDHVSGSTRPVTNFSVNTAVYNANRKSDRDKDGIACEKR